jgi:hypothetical protein
MGAGVGLIGVVGAATLLAILFRGGGSGSGTGGTGQGAGRGAGTSAGGTAATQAVLATAPTRPMKVTIEESSYVVNGRRLDLEGVTELAGQVPSGDGPAVVVERPGTSRAKAEEDLFNALQKRGIPYMRD